MAAGMFVVHRTRLIIMVVDGILLLLVDFTMSLWRNILIAKTPKTPANANNFHKSYSLGFRLPVVYVMYNTNAIISFFFV